VTGPAVPSEHQEMLFYWRSDGALTPIAQRGCGVSCLGDIQKPSGHCPGQSHLGGPAWAGSWTRWPPEVCSSLYLSV